MLEKEEIFYPENFMINDLVREWKKQGHLVDIISQYPSYPYGYVFEGYKNKGESVELWENSKIFRFKFIYAKLKKSFKLPTPFKIFYKSRRHRASCQKPLILSTDYLI